MKPKPLTKPYEELTEKQKLFIEFYIQTLNAKESAKKAGFVSHAKNPDNALQQRGFELKNMLMPYIEARIDTSKREQAIMDTNEILATLSRIARGEEKDAFGLDTSNQDKLKALELLGKANQLYVDKVKQETNLDINVSLVDEEEPELIEGGIVEEGRLEEGERKLLEEGEE